ncbi:PaaX family transcriptional regulator C-terminal domain-containing protein [Labrenzia sp. DG1229]|uniref:PaaX family transcriptional regulator C-terminal domain-containing protein n=1 Tax=Labrenzia sp. DG1229 TaxID=681847 RepID=UPI00048BB384|nr:PaaX family transcriptional regulator C-terminal domain-containing protein [Labrenzia sp. DG1229]
MSTAETNAKFQALPGADVPRAPVFIVTLYGDAIEPRGGTLWMGDLVTCCARQGISESLVRTAVSRLVTAGKLFGERIGRKSFYRLTGQAQAEFRKAARVLYAPPPPARGWLVAANAAGALPEGWASLGQGAAIAPNRDDIALPAGPLLSAETVGDSAGWPALAADYWDLQDVADRYKRFLLRFEALGALLKSGKGAIDLEGEEALALRLQLVHHYRLAALKDPRLPRDAWPSDWPAEEARQLFVRAYLSLSAEADAFVGLTFRDAIGLLPLATEATCLRLDRLEREAAMLMC